MSDTQISAEQVNDTNREVGAAVAEAVTEKKPETFDQTFDRVATEIFEGKRGPDGKFQSRVVAQGAPETTEVPGRPEAAPPELAKPAIEAPQSLPDDVKRAWSSLPPEHQQWLAKRESEIHEKITADGQRLKSLSAFEEVLKPFESRLKQVGAPPHEYFRRLGAADHLLSTDFDAGIAEIHRMYGRTPPQRIGNQPGSQPSQQQTPDVAALVDQRVQEALREQRVEAQKGEIEKFKSGLAADEQPDFDRLMDSMAGLAQANPKWSLDQLYKAARRADPDTLAKDEAKVKAEAAKKAEEEAKKKAEQDRRLGPQSTRPGSAPTGPIKGKTMWDTLEKVGKEVMAR